MELEEHWGSGDSENKSVDSVVCSPGRVRDKRPARVRIQEIWGVDEHIQDMARRYASAGYFVAAPDLYSKGGKDAARSPGRITELKDFLDRAPMSVIMNEDERKKFVEREGPDRARRLVETMESIFKGRDMDGMVKTLNDTVSLLKGDMGATSVGTVGYCMGGALSFMMSTNREVDASVVYYGVAPEDEKLKDVSSPVLGLYGGEDHRVFDAGSYVSSKLKDLGKSYQYRIYDGAQHAFFNDTRSSYGYGASKDAWARTLEFFRANLK